MGQIKISFDKNWRLRLFFFGNIIVVSVSLRRTILSSILGMLQFNIKTLKIDSKLHFKKRIKVLKPHRQPSGCYGVTNAIGS